MKNNLFLILFLEIIVIIVTCFIILFIFHIHFPILKAHGQVLPSQVLPTIDPEDCLAPGQIDEDHSSDDVLCITPTPTETPVPSQPSESQSSSSPAPSGNSSTTNPPGNPTCTISVDAPILQGFKRTSPTSIIWSWWASKTQGIQSQWVEYGYSKGNYPFTKIISPTDTGTEISALNPQSTQNWARVCVQKDGCVACSQPLDP